MIGNMIESKNNETDLCRYDMYDVVEKYLDGEVTLDEGKLKIKKLIDEKEDNKNIFTDLLSLIDIEIQTSECKDKLSKFAILLSSLKNNIIPTQTILSQLDLEALEQAHFIPSTKLYHQKTVRMKTKLFYKQQKFNLLREESEGYAKLISQLLQYHPDRGISLNKTKEIVSQLIGYFNLDPCRVLDIILEVFSHKLLESDCFIFFIKLIKYYWNEPKVIIQLLAFRFNNYRIKNQNPPQAVYDVTALLIINGILEVADIYPHLLPDDKILQLSTDARVNEIKSFIKRLNPTRLKELEDYQDTCIDKAGLELWTYPPSFTSLDASSQNTNQSSNTNLNLNIITNENNTINQKLEMARSLIKFGGWPHLHYMIQNHPHLYMYMDLEIMSHVCKYLQFVLNPLYLKCAKKVCPVIKSSTTPIVSNITLAILNRSSKVNDLPTFFARYKPLIDFLGPLIYDRSNLLVINQLVRVLDHYLATNSLKFSNIDTCESDVTYCDILDTLRCSLLPSLSQSSYNCCLSESIGRMMKHIHYQHRYNLYSNWKAPVSLTTTDDEYLLTHGDVMVSKIKTNIKSKYIMRRLSKDNIKQMGRQIGKLSHSNPGVLFEHVLNQIQYYENLITPVIDTLRYITSLSFDILMYCLLESLCRGRSLSTSITAGPILDRDAWFSNACSFAGSVVKKYAACDVTGLLYYAVNGLKVAAFSGTGFRGPVTDLNESGKTEIEPGETENLSRTSQRGSELLLVLKELVHKMSGIEMNDTASTREQIEALSGGDLLKSEAGYFSQIRNTKRSSQRLKESLINSDILIPMAILISQQRDCEIFNPTLPPINDNNNETSVTTNDSDHIKLLGKLYDQAQDALVQYVTFVSTNFAVEEYVHLLPSLPALINDYHLAFDAAFFIRRHSLALTLKGNKYFEVLKHLLADEAEHVAALMPPKVWEDISPLFFVTFWTFSRYDIYFPAEAYAREIAKLKHTLNALDENNRDSLPVKKKKEKEKLVSLVDKLKEEENVQKEHVKAINEVFDQIKSDWFYQQASRNDMITQFLQKCIFPRVAFSVTDAIYCAEFIKLLHCLKTPYFATLICFDRIFCDVTYIMISLTENEAARYGIFLNSLMETALSWHSTYDNYKKECIGFPGFNVLKNNPSSTIDPSFPKLVNDSAQTSSGSVNPTSAGMDATSTTAKKLSHQSPSNQQYLSYEDFRHVCHKWHFKMTKSVVLCLESGHYASIRNTMIVLTKILPSYPIIVNLGSALERRIDKIKNEEKDKRADLYALAVSYSGYLKHKKSKFILEQDFHIKEPASSHKQDKLKSNNNPPSNMVAAASKDKCVKTTEKTPNNIASSPAAIKPTKTLADTHVEKLTIKKASPIITDIAEKHKLVPTPPSQNGMMPLVHKETNQDSSHKDVAKEKPTDVFKVNAKEVTNADVLKRLLSPQKSFSNDGITGLDLQTGLDYIKMAQKSPLITPKRNLNTNYTPTHGSREKDKITDGLDKPIHVPIPRQNSKSINLAEDRRNSGINSDYKVHSMNSKARSNSPDFQAAVQSNPSHFLQEIGISPKRARSSVSPNGLVTKHEKKLNSGSSHKTRSHKSASLSSQKRSKRTPKSDHSATISHLHNQPLKSKERKLKKKTKEKRSTFPCTKLRMRTKNSNAESLLATPSAAITDDIKISIKSADNQSSRRRRFSRTQENDSLTLKSNRKAYRRSDLTAKQTTAPDALNNNSDATITNTLILSVPPSEPFNIASLKSAPKNRHQLQTKSRNTNIISLVRKAVNQIFPPSSRQQRPSSPVYQPSNQLPTRRASSVEDISDVEEGGDAPFSCNAATGSRVVSSIVLSRIRRESQKSEKQQHHKHRHHGRRP
ncbi:unnamed protein product [Gordionus sp. m RMFG-2023]|uniref:THO complex subunit 2-like isoform X3 n=1 Tax=Gordionus sp. m RMFG-2023 TaxID=3053472 RepID=UPI0030DFA03C